MFDTKLQIQPAILCSLENRGPMLPNKYLQP